MVFMIMSWIAIVYLYVYMLAWLSRWLGYDIMVIACRNLWGFFFFGMIGTYLNGESTRPVLLLIRPC